MKMKAPPIPVIIASIVFILAGAVGFVYHVKDFLKSDVQIFELILIESLRILAVVCGLLLLFRVSWARWLAIAWLIYHIVISVFHSTSEMIIHIIFLIIMSTLLFLPVSSVYFRRKNKQ